MEENIHDDKLDDYVRKSFEGHEEDPPADMWSRVEGDLLPSAEIAVPRAAYLRYGWQALAAVVILVLFSLLVCEHIYYEEKLSAMAAKPLEQQEVLSNRKNGGEHTEQQVHSNTDSQSTSIAPSLPQSSTQKSNLENTPKQGPTDALSTATQGQPIGKTILTGIPQSQALFPQNAQALSDTADTGGSTPSVSGASMAELAVGQPRAEPNTATPVVQPHLEIAFMPLSSKLLELPIPSFKALLPPLFPVKPVHQSSNGYVGVQTSLLASIVKSRPPISRPGRPAFSNNQENTGVSTIWWLKTGKKLGTRFSLESGVGYQETARTATHTPRFRFGDGIHQGGPLATRRTFNYDLSTYDGTAELSLRMEQTTPGTPVPDDEPLSLKITTSERTKLLRIPMLAGYRIGSGRWQGQVKVGLIGNFVLKSELDISARVSQNSRFRPVGGSEGYTVQLNPKKFFLGYWLSAGTEFKLNQRVSLVAESALVGDFPRNDPYSRPLPQRFMLGLNVGANYYF